MKKRSVLVLATVLVSASRVRAEWPQYLGPNRNAISPETGLARTWPKEGPKVLWTFPLGPGFGGPAVSGGKVYLLDRIDLVSGKEEWKLAYDAPGKTVGFKPLASAKLLDTPRCWAPLALAHGKLLIRDQKQMKCVAVR